jgi:hypothetical protein
VKFSDLWISRRRNNFLRKLQKLYMSRMTSPIGRISTKLDRFEQGRRNVLKSEDAWAIASAGARAYTVGLGLAPSEVQGQSSWSGVGGEHTAHSLTRNMLLVNIYHAASANEVRIIKHLFSVISFLLKILGEWLEDQENQEHLYPVLMNVQNFQTVKSTMRHRKT